jgi:WD40 repeat protein
MGGIPQVANQVFAPRIPEKCSMSESANKNRPAFDPKKTQKVAEYKHTRPLLGCRFDPAGRFVVVGAQGNEVARWSLADGKKTDLLGHDSWVRALACSRDGSKLITGDYGGRVSCWSIPEPAPKPLWTVPAHQGWVRAVAVSPDNQLLATVGNDHFVRLWSMEGKPIRELAGHACHVYHTAFHPAGKLLVSADLKGAVHVWDFATGKLTRSLDAKLLWKFDSGFAADIGGVRGMAFSSDGSLLACAGITEVTNAFAGVGQPLVVLFDFNSGKHKHLLRCDKSFQGVCWGIVIHAAGLAIGAGGGGSGGAVWFWNVDDGKLVHSISSPSPARDIDLHPDNRRIATAHYDATLQVHQLSS